MYGRYGIRVGRGKINTGQYQKPIGSNILCPKQIEPTAHPQWIFKMFIRSFFKCKGCCEQAAWTKTLFFLNFIIINKRYNIYAVSKSLILSLLHLFFSFVKVGNSIFLDPTQKNVFTAEWKWQKAILLLKLGLLCTKTFSSSSCPIKVETKSVLSLLEYDYSQGTELP